MFSDPPIMLKKALIPCVFAILIAWSCIRPAYADEETEARSAVYDAYKIVQAVSVPLAVIGVAGSAIQSASSDVANAARARKRIVIILFALAAVWLIPLCIGMGKGILSAGAWDPANPG